MPNNVGDRDDVWTAMFALVNARKRMSSFVDRVPVTTPVTLTRAMSTGINDAEAPESLSDVDWLSKKERRVSGIVGENAQPGSAVLLEALLASRRIGRP